MPISHPPFNEDLILVDEEGETITDEDGNVIIDE